ncbi:antirestriction protein ArdA [Lacrimispora defluvii]|uniref:Antirestriction protein ArdA n=1 Tax=Lacrimispora defluvii TaxID=2719233 RepID=A0ABX1VMJ4_9FIRM|nr:antirestriction protein ArdA [Lacrimispora defluvii]NNJ28580.1 antirestriction protein ArdA [Lacrimispora defluvii]
MIQALLSNRRRPDLPPVPVCFPIADYAGIYENLQAVGIGSIAVRDCFVRELGGDYPIFKRLGETEINVDELDYLAKRLESFDKYELAQFQGAAVSQDYSNMTDFINLTFCCQGVTVVQDFTNLDAVGRTHYMNLHGGMTEEELRMVDFQKTALSLLLNEKGAITPYGVVYENGMELELCYDGLYFPDYRYSGDTILTIAATDRSLPEDTMDISWLYLPAEDCQIERALLRAGIQDEDMRLRYDDTELPALLVDLMGPQENLYEINRLCACFQKLDSDSRLKAEAALQMASPSDIAQASNLLSQLDLFDFIPGIATPEEYGRYMIIDSGHYEFDENLEKYIDFKEYGKQRMAGEYGRFTENGYISYQGFISIEEVMAGSETERMDKEMGGMQL